MTEEFAKLIRKRGSVKCKMTVFSKYVVDIVNKYPEMHISDNNEIIELQERLTKNESLFDEFDKVQSQIEEFSDDVDIEIQMLERETFTNSFFSIISKARNLLNCNTYDDEVASTGSSGNNRGSPSHGEVKQQPGTSRTNNVTGANIIGASTNNDTLMQNIKLPIISLPKFDGNYEIWLEFRDTFDSLIHSNPNIQQINKFHYLRASLEGGAYQIIASLEFSGDNYQVAWDLICDRYNNNRILIQNHVKAIYNIDKIHDESSIAIRKTIDNVSKHLRALKKLQQPIESWDTLIIYLISNKLDVKTAREWEEKRASFDSPTLKDLNKFLKDRADLLESLEQAKTTKGRNQTKGTRVNSYFTQKLRCVVCNGEHYIQNCADFNKLSVTDRIESVKRNKLCINCLRSGHMAKQCSSGSCKRCKARHNTLLHLNNESTSAARTNNTETPSVSTMSAQNYNCSQVLLSTVQVKVYDNNNEAHKVRALLDAGSQSNFITSKLCENLKLNKRRVNINVCGFNQSSSEISEQTTVRIQSRVNNYTTKVSCLVTPHITNDLPNVKLNLNSLKIPQNIELADPEFHSPGKVDMLLGVDCFWQIMCTGQINLSNRGPFLRKTSFGWIVAGSVQTNLARTTICNLALNNDVDKQIVRFWEIEEILDNKLLSSEETSCEKHFVENVRRDESGKFIVKIPFKDSLSKLGNSFDNARKRFLSLERKFAQNIEFKQKYVNFIHEYMQLGHMVKVPRFDNVQYSYYMPHHGVIKESSLTTKLRVVFDASSPTSSGYSLNSLQMVGPTIQPDLLTSLIRYRKYNIILSADIEKMYRMVQIDPSEWPLQRILWRNHPNEPLCSYNLTTVTYGTASASFLAIRCLQQLAIDCQEKFPKISNIIKNHFYVDDLLTGGDTEQEVVDIANNINRILIQGGFKLYKWVSNSSNVLKKIQTSDKNNQNVINFGSNENTKTLGMLYNGFTDCVFYNIERNTNRKITKRSLVSEISQIFDPLGLLTPCTIVAKIMIQELWQLKLSWDESVPSELHTRWLNFRDNLTILNSLRIPRQVICSNPIRISLHGFSDASTKAYGACVYVVSRSQNGKIHINLVSAKSKVAPLKSLTVPRLELMAALLLAKLMHKIKLSLDIEFDSITYWCDSTIVLGWLNTPPSRLQTFVGNRVVIIQNLSNNNIWRHIPTADNPADHVSRGSHPQTLLSLKLYWNGPSFLADDESTWPKTFVSNEDLPETRKQTSSNLIVNSTLSFPIENYSNLTRLERIIAYCLRFINNCSKNKSNKQLGPLSCSETQQANFYLIKLSQQESFAEDIHALKRGTNVHCKSKLIKLNPFLDENFILRVGGRLNYSNLSYQRKHPIVLSAKHHFTRLLFMREHKRLLHAGQQHLLYAIRQHFWPINGRNLARKIVHECIQCFKVKPRFVTPIMGCLPSTRVVPSPPFFVTGVDYAGPLRIKDRQGRGCKIHKCYVSLFICFTTKAVHLELVSDLSKEAFLAALRRFVARRGKPCQIYSDNGTNFVGANTELQRLGEFITKESKVLTEHIENEGIKWSFIPPSSPHFGGLWEAGVKSSKFHLHRVAGNAILTFEQLYTLLVQIEAVLNSRPMYPMTSDPSDLTPITPSHFLIGRPLTSVADPSLLHINESRLNHYQRIQQLQQHFWTRWSKEYITELQQRVKWPKNMGSLRKGDLVIIKDDSLPPLKWSLGRVIDLVPGVDGIARVASIRTKGNNIIKRSFSKLCPLPTSE